MGNHTNHKNHTNHSSDNPLRAPSCPSWTIPVIPTAHPSFRRRPESRGAGTWGIPPITKITRITVQTTPFAPLRVLRGQSPSFQPPTRHSGGGRNPEGRGRGESHQSQKSHESQFRQPPSRPLVSFVDNPRHSNRPPVIPAAAGIQRGGDTKIPRITVQTTPFAPLRGIPLIPQKSHESQFRQLPSRPFVSFVDNPRHSNRPPVIPAAAGIQRGGDVGNPTNHKNHESQFRQLPSRPLVSFVDNPRHSNRPPVIPAAAGIQRGGDVGNPTNHKNHTNHSSDNPFAPLSVLRG